MANLKEMAESRSAILNFDPRKIAIKDGLNGRDMTAVDTREHVDFLKASIRENGFFQNSPLEIFSEGDAVFVSDGHCRLTAVHELIAEGVEIKTVACVPEGRGVNDVDRILRQSTSNSGKRLTPLEEAGNVKRALGYGMTIPEVARRIGKSVAYIYRLLELLQAPAEVHALIKDGKVSATLASETLRDDDGAEKLKAAVEKAESEGRARVTKKDVDGRPRVSRDRIMVVLGECSTALEHANPDLAAKVDQLVIDLGG